MGILSKAARIPELGRGPNKVFAVATALDENLWQTQAWVARGAEAAPVPIDSHYVYDFRHALNLHYSKLEVEHPKVRRLDVVSPDAEVSSIVQAARLMVISFAQEVGVLDPAQ